MKQNRFHGNVFVANLPNDYTDEQLAQLFDPFGIVVSAFLARDGATGQRRGFGLVNVAPDAVANTAIAALNGTQIGNRRIEVRRSDPEMSIAIPKLRSSAPRNPYAGPRAEAASVPAQVRPPVVVEYRRSRRVIPTSRPS